VFRGIQSCNVDAKGRFALPKKTRESVEQIAKDDLRMVVTLDAQDPCLLLYPWAAWQEIEQKIQALPTLNPAARRIQRLLIGHACELELDGAGRFLLPGLLREQVQIDRKLMLVGQGHKYEIWSEAGWAAQRQSLLASAESQSVFDDLPSGHGEIVL